MARKVNKVTIENPVTGNRRHFTSIRPQTKTTPAGWAVQCIDHLTDPYTSEDGAWRRLGICELTCPHQHDVVPVWETFPGCVGGPSPDDDGFAEDLMKVVISPSPDGVTVLPEDAVLELFFAGLEIMAARVAEHDA